MIVENAKYSAFVALAQKCDTVEQFIQKTDGMDVLYRGQYGPSVPDHAFMTDYVSHAAQYGDGLSNVYAYAVDWHDVLNIDDSTFEKFRQEFSTLSVKQFGAIYQQALIGNRFADSINYRKDVNVARKIIHSDKPYSAVCGNPELNDTLIPLLQYWAREQGKNIISFLGNDYADYGGQMEYVVSDISKLTDLRELYARIHSSRI